MTRNRGDALPPDDEAAERIEGLSSGRSNIININAFGDKHFIGKSLSWSGTLKMRRLSRDAGY